MKSYRPHSSRRRQSRRGVTTVEFAFVAPMLFLFLFGAIELARAHMISHTVQNAAYEAARRGIVPGATVALVEATANSLLSSASINGAVITVDPTTIQTTTEEIRVTIRVPVDANTWLPPRFFAGKSVESSCLLRRELYGNLL